jgi:RimJ/RimL family protein N-acetyltransferase
MDHFTTARLIARDWNESDVHAAFAIYGRDEVARWLGPLPPEPVQSVAQMRTVLDRRIDRCLQQPDYGLWALELRATGQVAGAVLLSPLPGDGQTSQYYGLTLELFELTRAKATVCA